MGYEDVRVKGEIRNSDRCNLCGLLCSIDLFIETKCYHLFCAECFMDYLKRNGHSPHIRDETNYVKMYHLVRCPVSNRILEHKHTKGALYLKIKQFYNLSRYKIKCEFYPVGCYAEMKPSKLNEHYMQCFFTSRRVGYDRSKDFHVIQPVDFCTNNLYDEMSLRTELIGDFECKQVDAFTTTGRLEQSRLIENFKDESDVKYELIDEYLNEDSRPAERTNRSKSANNDNASRAERSTTGLSLSDCLLVENCKLKNSALNVLIDQDAEELTELSRRVDVLQKNVNFIKEHLLQPQMTQLSAKKI